VSRDSASNQMRARREFTGSPASNSRHFQAHVIACESTDITTMGFMKPFKTPSLVGKNTLNSRPPPLLDEDRPKKRQRIGADDENDDQSGDSEVESVSAAAKVLKTPKVVSKSISKFQTPLQQKQVNAVANPTNASSSSSPRSEEKTSSGQEGYYTVLWYVSAVSAVIKRC
jgi:hypothetical protein